MPAWILGPVLNLGGFGHARRSILDRSSRDEKICETVLGKRYLMGRSKDPTSELEIDENQPDRKTLAAFVVANVDLERREGLLGRLNAWSAEPPNELRQEVGRQVTRKRPFVWSLLGVGNATNASRIGGGEGVGYGAM